MSDRINRMVREARPERSSDPTEFDGVRAKVLSANSIVRPERSATAPRLRWGIAGGALAAAAVGALAVALTLTAPTPGQKSAVPSAYAKVRHAVAVTARSAESGTISTEVKADWRDGRGHIDIGTLVTWSGEDVSLSVAAKQDGDAQGGKLAEVTRFVGGEYFERDAENTDAKWVHHTTSPSGSALTWADAARKDISGERLNGIVDVLRDLKDEQRTDGTTVYTGVSTAKEIDADYRDTKGLPYISRPFIKLGDPETPVAVEIVVGSDGVIDSWSCAYDWDNAHWIYRADYRDLGESPAIVAPAPGQVEESDGSWG